MLALPLRFNYQEITMRERLDCAVLSTPCCFDWLGPWLGPHAAGKLQLHPLDGCNATVDSVESARLLAASSMRLRRYDACLIPVNESNLAWARTSLSMAKGALHTPVVALVRNLKAAALDDLHTLGLADFVRDPLCIEELRARIERLLDGNRYLASPPAARSSISENRANYTRMAGLAGPLTQEALCATILDRSGTELEAFAIASASRCATTRESFRAAKSQVIERFERAYITAALGRHSGNIAMAARAAQKHRRAFWALMRKHDIDAAPFRAEAVPNHPGDG